MLRGQPSLISAARSGSSSREKDKVSCRFSVCETQVKGVRGSVTTPVPAPARQNGRAGTCGRDGDLGGEEHPVTFRAPRGDPVGPDRRPRPPARPRECQACSQILQVSPARESQDSGLPGEAQAITTAIGPLVANPSASARARMATSSAACPLSTSRIS
jgi:hypothetical protein